MSRKISYSPRSCMGQANVHIYACSRAPWKFSRDFFFCKFTHATL